MKKIVIVDDRPWKFQVAVKTLQAKGVIFYRTIYYPSNTLGKDSEDRLMSDYKNDTKMKILQVNNQIEFLDRMDELFDELDTIFLVDYDLKGDMSREDFYTRINVKYAMTMGWERIWFYTSGPSDIKGMLMRTFPDHVISVEADPDGYSSWDEKQILAAVRTE